MLTHVALLPEIIELLDDDIVSLTALTLIVNPTCSVLRVRMHHPADSVAVSDDSMPVEAPSLNDDIGSDLRLH